MDGFRLPSLFLPCALLLAGCSFDSGGLPPTGDAAAADGHHTDVSNTLDQVVEGREDQLTPDSCRDGRLDTPAPDTLTPDTLKPDTISPCPTGQTRCSGTCVNLKVNPNHCGQCNKACISSQTCSSGLCCNTGLTSCGGVCVDTSTDTAHCGGCNKPCTALQLCAGGGCITVGCADGTDDQVFTQGMRGCAGVITFPQRATFCASGFRVCTAAEWVARRASVAPTHNYWTNNILNYWGSGSNDCYALASGGASCTGNGTTPMRVCATWTDPLGNTCNWINCGLNSKTPNQYFGGCNSNKTAGTLCCPQ